MNSLNYSTRIRAGHALSDEELWTEQERLSEPVPVPPSKPAVGEFAWKPISNGSRHILCRRGGQTVGAVRPNANCTRWIAQGEEEYRDGSYVGRKPLGEYRTEERAKAAVEAGSGSGDAPEVCEHCGDYCGNGCVVHRHERWGWRQ